MARNRPPLTVEEISLTDVRFDNRRGAVVDQVDLGLDWIDADDFVSSVGEASRRYGADIA